MSDLDENVLKEYDKEIEERFGLEPLKSTEEKVLDRLKRYLKEEAIANQSNINNNHYNMEDIRDTKRIGDMLYKMEPITFLYEELLTLLDTWEKEYERRKKRVYKGSCSGKKKKG